MMLLNCCVGKDSWESFGLQGDQTSQSWRKSILNIHWREWCWSGRSNILATWCNKPTRWQRLWCWERLKARGEGNDRGGDDWITSLTQWVSDISVRIAHLQEMAKDREAWACCHPWVAKSWTWLNDWTPVRGDTRELPLSFSSPCESAVSAVTWQLGSELSPEPHHAGVLTSDFQPPRLWYTLCYFVVVAPADTYLR